MVKRGKYESQTCFIYLLRNFRWWKINGNANNPYTGLFFALHQIDFSGNPSLTGQVIARDLADTNTEFVPLNPLGEGRT